MSMTPTELALLCRATNSDTTIFAITKTVKIISCANVYCLVSIKNLFWQQKCINFSNDCSECSNKQFLAFVNKVKVSSCPSMQNNSQ